MTRPFAVFDIDGTVIRWQLYHAVADELVRLGYIRPEQYEAVKEARWRWKNRASQTAFDDYELQLVKLIESVITGLDVGAVQQACQRVIERYKDQVYAYTRNLIRKLKAEGWLLFAISASQAEIVKLIADYYGFDDSGGTRYEIKDGAFTGKSHVLKSANKPEFLQKLVERHSATWENSVGVGDSESDIPMLSIVQRPIAFNPTQKLFEHAKRQGWQVVLERKNVVYELEPDSGGYRLHA